MLLFSATIGASFSRWNLATNIETLPSILKLRVTRDQPFEAIADTGVDLGRKGGGIWQGKNIKRLVQRSLMNGRTALQLPVLA